MAHLSRFPAAVNHISRSFLINLRKKTGSGGTVAVALILLSGLLLLAPGVSQAQEEGELRIVKTVAEDVVLAGQYFTYFLRYRCASINTDCRNVVVTDVLPPELAADGADVVLVGGLPHLTTQTYDSATRTATWRFVDPLPAGSTGELKLRVRFPIGVTPDGTTATNIARIEASNAPASVSPPVTVTARANVDWRVEKLVEGGSAVDAPVTYRVRICRGTTTGNLNLADVTVTDVLPQGAIFISASDGGQYDPATRAVTWRFGELPVTSFECQLRWLTVRFPSPPFQEGDTVRNTVRMTATPIGEEPITREGIVDHLLEAPSPDMAVRKRSLGTDQSAVGDTVNYYFAVSNTGNVPLEGVVIIDTIPPQLDVTVIRVGNPNQPHGSFIIDVQYQTNLNSGFSPVPGSPFSTPPGFEVPVSALNLAPGEYITRLRWDYGTVPSGFSDTSPEASGFRGIVLPVDRNGVPVNIGDIIDNCVTYIGSYPPIDRVIEGSSCQPTRTTAPRPRPGVIKSILNGDPADPGDIVEYAVELRNPPTATASLQNPVIADLLHEDLIYVANSWSFNGPPGAPVPMFEQVDNYHGTGRTLLRWRWIGSAAYQLPAGEALRVTYQAQVRPGTLAGELDNEAHLVQWQNPEINSSDCYDLVPDTDDLDGDGNTTELICSSGPITLIINATAVLESVKWVRGQLDETWTRTPNWGVTVPGGRADYRLIVTNVGNVPVTSLYMVDILPYVGDTGVVDLSPRLSEWRPILNGPVAAPDGVTVSYSTAMQPCRPLLIPSGPPGCTPPNWSTTPPADLNTVQSLQFDFGNMVLAPGEYLELIWPMLAPPDTPTGGETAWNSFGYVARRVDNGAPLLSSEPLKVGIATLPFPSLRVNKDLLPPGVVNGLITFTITISNPAPVPLATVPLIDRFSGPVEYVGGVPPADRVDNNSGLLVWHDLTRPGQGGFGQNLPPGQAFVVSTVFRVTTTADTFNMRNTAIVTDVQDIAGNPIPPNQDTVVVSNEPTAVELLSFEAFRQANQVILTWITAVEIDNFGFRLLRSPTGQLADAVEIGFVSGQGRGTGEGASYSFTDADIAADQSYTYWLVDVDLNGTETVHPVPGLVQSSEPGGAADIFLPLILK